MNLSQSSWRLPLIPTWFIPTPFILTLLGNVPSSDSSLKIEQIADDELADIIKSRCDPQRQSLISAVFEEPDFLPIVFLELGLRRAASVCRIVRQCSDSAINQLIPKIVIDLEQRALSGNYFTKDELIEIFCMSDKGEEVIQKIFQGSDDRQPSKALTLESLTALQPIPIGTGFTVGDNYLLTNHHVIPDISVAKECIAQFGYEQDILGRKFSPIEYEFDCEVFVTNKDLDYTFVKLKPHESLGKAGDVFGSVTMNSSKTLIAPPVCSEEIERLRNDGYNLAIKEGDSLLGEPVNIIQHPKGQRKQVALSNNRMLDIDRDFLRYEADADFSSSGSPVFNQQWQLVGLHHAAIAKLDEDGNPVPKAPNAKTFQIEAQQGVRIYRIVEDLQKQALDLNPTATDEAIDKATPNDNKPIGATITPSKRPPTDYSLGEEIDQFIRYFVNQPSQQPNPDLKPSSSTRDNKRQFYSTFL